jgi:cyclohexadienyl dehydratase
MLCLLIHRNQFAAMMTKLETLTAKLGKTCCLAILLLLTTSIAQAQSLDELVTARLGQMKDVAAYKWINNRAIEDLEREKVVIDNAVNVGLGYQLETRSYGNFFKEQISAAKEIQRYWFNIWSRDPKSAPTSAPNLVDDIRPELIKLGNEITAALGQQSTLNGPLTVEGLSLETEKLLIDAANNIETYQSKMRQVLASRKLRVGTTGDYKPFSFISTSSPNETQTEQFAGIDIELAKDLAASLDAELILVQTSWPTLMQDLAAGKFDIGMSGISRNLNRQRTSFFTIPYHVGGKTPIIRCSDAQKYQTLADIDREGVRVIVNPGGTNFNFVKNKITYAFVQIFDDNTKIFDEIANNRADVMITDDIEVTLQSNLNPTLCPAMPEKTLTYSEKGYMLPQDTQWQGYVNLWLAQRIGDGTVDDLFGDFTQ